MLSAATASVARAQTPYYVLDAQGREAEARITPASGLSSVAVVDKGAPPAFLSDGTVPNPLLYNEWRLAPSNFAVARGDAGRFTVGFGQVGAPSGPNVSASFTSVLRYQPTGNSVAVVKLRVDPLQLFFGFTGGDLEDATPSFDVSLGASSSFAFSWFDMPTFKQVGPLYRSEALITNGGGGPLRVPVTSSEVVRGDDVETIATNPTISFVPDLGFASVTVPEVELEFGLSEFPIDASGGYAPLYLVYEMSVFGSLDILGAPTVRQPFMFARWGDPIAIGTGDRNPYITVVQESNPTEPEPMPVPEPSTLAMSLTGLVGLGWTARRRQRPRSARRR
jgi:hypothetical protein